MPSIVVERTKANPVRFAVGNHVFLRPDRIVGDGTVEMLHSFGPEETFIVTDVIYNRGFPHYWLQAPDGSDWLAPQLCLSSKTFGGFR